MRIQNLNCWAPVESNIYFLLRNQYSVNHAAHETIEADHQRGGKAAFVICRYRLRRLVYRCEVWKIIETTPIYSNGKLIHIGNMNNLHVYALYVKSLVYTRIRIWKAELLNKKQRNYLLSFSVKAKSTSKGCITLRLVQCSGVPGQPLNFVDWGRFCKRRRRSLCRIFRLKQWWHLHRLASSSRGR